MRIGNLDSYKEIRKDYLGYYLMAIFVGIMIGYIIIIVFKIGSFILQKIILYWLWVVGIILGLIFIRKFFGRKKIEISNRQVYYMA